jgi:hypothetical protein
MKDLWIQRRLSRHLEREGVVTLANGARNKSPDPRRLERSSYQSPCRDPPSVSCSNGMTDAQEKRLIEALRKVDAHGDVAPAHVQDPMTMVLRQRAIRADLMRWDDSRGHYVLTGTGRSRISARSRVPGAVVRFKTRNDRDDGAPHGK